MRDLPSGQTWWTIRVRESVRVHHLRRSHPLGPDASASHQVKNARTGKRYALIGHAIASAKAGDDDLAESGDLQRRTLRWAGGLLTVRSRDPNSAKAVASTIIKGQFDGPVVTFSSRQATGCVLEGLTVQGSTVGLSCQDAIPTIRDCVLNCTDGIAVEFWWGCKPRLIGCTVAGQVKEGGDPGLIAYWTLDETEGATAHDSVGTNDARVVGNPVWRPSGGKVKGALQLDGVGEYLTTGYVLDPGTGSFTVLAWVKGGAPGQVILSQDGGANWLLADASQDRLTTNLSAPAGQNPAKPLVSGTVITDGQWHRVGFAWDGKSRVLYVDDSEVARDAQARLAASTGGLHIGAGAYLATGTFWSGLIDDVRIYNRAVDP